MASLAQYVSPCIRPLGSACVLRMTLIACNRHNYQQLGRNSGRHTQPMRTPSYGPYTTISPSSCRAQENMASRQHLTPRQYQQDIINQIKNTNVRKKTVSSETTLFGCSTAEYQSMEPCNVFWTARSPLRWGDNPSSLCPHKNLSFP